jgi:hypothetical protein
MFARVTVVEGLADQWDKTKELLTTQAVPRTRGLRGCCASYRFFRERAPAFRPGLNRVVGSALLLDVGPEDV